jgi:hypothetical protein
MNHRAPFFIVARPRSRTAWLANFLTYGPAFCLHDGLRGCGTVGDLAHKLARLGVEYPGNADPGLPLVFTKVHERFPQARYVFVTRDPEEALESYRLIVGDRVPSEDIDAGWRRLEAAHDAMRSALAGQHYLEVSFAELEQCAACEAVWEYCVPGHPFPRARWEMLDALRVNVIPDKLIQELRQQGWGYPAPSPAKTAARVKGPDPVAQKAYYQLLADMCGATSLGRSAYLWLCAWLNLTLTWDHIQDNDPICKATANDALEAVLLDWPANEFWRACGLVLQPVLSATIAAWRTSDGLHGDRYEAWQAYTNVPLAVAQCLGGRALVAQWNEPIRKWVHAEFLRHELDASETPEEFRL